MGGKVAVFRTFQFRENRDGDVKRQKIDQLNRVCPEWGGWVTATSGMQNSEG